MAWKCWLLYLSLPISTGNAAKKGSVEFWQNCAARGPCSKRTEFRDLSSLKQPAQGAPKGHLKSLGDSAFLDSWDGEIEQLDTPPTPEVFWQKYHKENKPFLVKGSAASSPAMAWTDEYIMEKFGDEVAKVEWRNEDRLTDYCGQRIRGKYISCPKDTIPYVEERTSIRNFIRRTRQDEAWPKYIISQMPDKMGEDWTLPGFFNCGARPVGDTKPGKPWMTQLYENNFWYLKVPKDVMGTSTIHYDMNHQIMCLFAGKKEWIMWDLATDAKVIPMWNELYRANKGQTEGSDDSPIDGERVDLERWPEFAKARWTNVTMEKGDCLYTPAQRLHYVRSYSDDTEDRRIIALMTMFQREERYDPASCVDPPDYVRLSEYDVMWGEFPGSKAVPHCMNHIKMGYPNWKRRLTGLAGKELEEKAFVSYWARHSEYPKKRIRAAWKTFTEKESNAGSWAERVFNSTILAKLAKDIACADEGHQGPAKKPTEDDIWNHRMEYSMAGGQAGYTDEKHADL
mmetsp:Transcript_43025/g.96826  ORF Transcript_43025/g.96826 Transcript_43025/m.96826 type:complete len:512 (-) Transcript_43025:113-1648(-)